MLSIPEKQAILSSAMMTYLFNHAYAEENDGKKFDTEVWLQDIDNITSDPLFNISPAKEQELEETLTNLNKYAVDTLTKLDKKSIAQAKVNLNNQSNGNKLVLD